MTRGRRWPPLWGPVEAVAIGGQSRGRWEADDRCGDPATFAVDPAAVISFQVEVGTTAETNTERERDYVSLCTVHLPTQHVLSVMHAGKPFETILSTKKIQSELTDDDDDNDNLKNYIPEMFLYFCILWLHV